MSYDIIIQAGQSNAEGCGRGGVSREYAENGNVLYFTGDFAISTAREQQDGDEKVNNFSLSFAEEYINAGRLEKDRKLLILRTAVGGTGFVDKRWGMTDDLYLRMMQMIKQSLALHPENRLVTFLWHQGENDAHKEALQPHYNNLKSLIESVRTGFGYPKLPFIAGDFVNEWKTAHIEICEPVIAAIKKVCHDINYAAFVEAADLKSNNQDHGGGDDIHFCREALNILGERYFEAFVKI